VKLRWQKKGVTAKQDLDRRVSRQGDAIRVRNGGPKLGLGFGVQKRRNRFYEPFPDDFRGTRKVGEKKKGSLKTCRGAVEKPGRSVKESEVETIAKRRQRTKRKKKTER